MLTVTAYGANSATSPLEPLTIERRDVGPRDVLIAIRYAGICHSDIHTIREEWGPISFPQVVGHEIVGEVVEVGSEVTAHAVGDRVGVGCMVNSCGECAECLAGDEHNCENGNTQTYGSVDRDGTITQGGYSTHVVVDERFVLKVPESIPYEAAAPLLCAGITTYSPLARWGAGPEKKVAVVGMGGLGHMAVKIAVAMGADVTVLSRTDAKREDALAFGASRHVATGEEGALAGLAGTFDLIINTVSAALDMNAYLATLRPKGTLVNVGAPPEALPIQVFSLIMGGRSFAGSNIGSIRETQEMLDFCAEQGIAPEVEVIGAEAINDAYERVIAGDVRYRFVIDTATL
ncbi:NAD(P)-dependent alcohol dehydrogenase [Microbacterium sp. ZXX196]|uniref:NAD(P)-dependent alcohol dehydrogenase n=1 Tax=Microbacterium sp. ZXX196 TaxID=2609291 RepID=UPI0012B86E2F|nr:NAD(P)-dependent alcohol dehydrogenase [Microbacterium sp. ZXX196]MTE22999.1 alcohol dehydrogenase catalytic domain-containing protein [Microbacterium sp. ZXX196]